MSRIIKVINNETIEISDYRNSGYLFDHKLPTIKDIRKQISNIDDWCVFKETINPFVLYGEKEELQQRIDKAIEYINKKWKKNKYYQDIENCLTFCDFDKDELLNILNGGDE